jgi:hypothetical protein
VAVARARQLFEQLSQLDAGASIAQGAGRPDDAGRPAPPAAKRLRVASHARVLRCQLDDPPSSTHDPRRDERLEPTAAVPDAPRTTVDERRARDAGRRAADDSFAGGVHDGADMHRWVRAAIEHARTRPPSFASVRNLLDAARVELRSASMPDPHPRLIRPAIVAATGRPTRWARTPDGMRRTDAGAPTSGVTHGRAPTDSHRRHSSPGQAHPPAE